MQPTPAWRARLMPAFPVGSGGVPVLRFLTAGESHGPALLATLDGIPAGMRLTREEIDSQLRRRQHGDGRGAPMAIEQGKGENLSGGRHGPKLGRPIALVDAQPRWP